MFLSYWPIIYFVFATIFALLVILMATLFAATCIAKDPAFYCIPSILVSLLLMVNYTHASYERKQFDTTVQTLVKEECGSEVAWISYDLRPDDNGPISGSFSSLNSPSETDFIVFCEDGEITDILLNDMTYESIIQ